MYNIVIKPIDDQRLSHIKFTKKPQWHYSTPEMLQTIPYIEGYFNYIG